MNDLVNRHRENGTTVFSVAARRKKPQTGRKSSCEADLVGALDRTEEKAPGLLRGLRLASFIKNIWVIRDVRIFDIISNIEVLLCRIFEYFYEERDTRD